MRRRKFKSKYNKRSFKKRLKKNRSTRVSRYGSSRGGIRL